ncbi:hypothetical protein [Kordiimonas sp. SCSIO 12610]|uniref:hypothetical protein n=1 Tax=Kordiimonas sp. SCSIO 12610 TaxID=2829597 RepID=UPI0021086435|nr:hypothetical protein [Kordiimonas sp. SCSIO 12610]UTW55491.1 hypothetical protein KFF44_00950 [Kordiimonas sp. SCSIO 12610]
MKPAAKQYFKDLLIGIGLYIVILISTNIAIKVWELSIEVKTLMAFSCAAPALLVIRAVLKFSTTWDELQRKKALEATLISFLLVGMGTFTYGFMEMIGFPHLPMVWVFPILYMTQSLAMIYVTRKYQ